jgi:hypothetical protein
MLFCDTIVKPELARGTGITGKVVISIIQGGNEEYLCCFGKGSPPKNSN